MNGLVDGKAVFRSISIKLFLSLCMITCLMVVLGSLGYTFDTKIMGKMKKRIEAVYVGEGDGQGFSFKDYERIKKNYDRGETSAVGEIRTRIETGFNMRSSDVKVVLTDENYINFFPYVELTKGGFINEALCKSKDNALVISEELARKLFLRADVVGNSVWALGKKYEIVGVYRIERTVMHYLTDDGYERVFVPYTSIEIGSSRVDYIMVNGLRYNYGAAYTLDEIINRTLNSNAAGDYVVKDYHKYEVILYGLNNLMLFILGLCCIVLMARRLLRLLRKSFMLYKSQFRYSYFLEIIKRNALAIGASLITASVYSGIIIFIVNLIKFEFYVPHRYIPAENIFDIGFYINQIRSIIRDSNAFYEVNYVPFNALFQTSFKIELLIIAVLLILFIDFGISLRLLNGLNQNPLVQVIYTIFSILAGMVSGYAVVRLMGLGCNVLVRYAILIVLILWLSMRQFFLYPFYDNIPYSNTNL